MTGGRTAADARWIEQHLPEAYGTPCPRCGLPMLKGQELDGGHSVDLAVDPSARVDQIEHATCNRRAGQQLSTDRAKYQPSRPW